ncbi:response regulator [Salinibacillus aidingensis]|uniref:Response regulator n=1 Tax=Salinibacillus aidingensis TaxID=237684 RepID=A0ABN1AZ08_9BACI
MNVLVVDDEPLEIEQLSFLIKNKYPDWEIYTAEDAVEAKQIFKETKIPLSLIDIHLPGQSGLDLCEYIRKCEIKTSIVLITAYQDFSYAQKAIRLEVMDYLVKPVIESEFFQVIDHFLESNPDIETKSETINKVLDIVREDYNQKLQLPDIAKRVYVTPAYLSKKFTEEAGIHFTEYLNYYRIQKAKQFILKKPEWTLFEVAERVGFSSQNHFSNLFKKIEGMTPSQFKENKYD